MKKMIIAAAAVLFGIGTFAQDAKSIYSQYSDKDGVEAVYISPAMFRLIGKIPDLEIEDENVNLASLLQSIRGFYLLNTERPGIGNALYAAAEQYVKKGRYELLLEAKDSGEATRIYTVGTEKVVNGFVLLSKDGSETSFIAIDGEMDRAMLEDTLANVISSDN